MAAEDVAQGQFVQTDLLSLWAFHIKIACEEGVDSLAGGMALPDTSASCGQAYVCPEYGVPSSNCWDLRAYYLRIPDYVYIQRTNESER